MSELVRRTSATSVPMQVRLPLWAREYIAKRAHDRRTTQKEVLIEAIECLRESEIEALMDEGYLELAGSRSEIVEAGLTAALPAIPR
ncbi:MAG TPA: hypothetical protein VJ787_02365 [Thermoleophilia bacterium]|nr:hypothetical protein [Thermoleophilia bacterium]